jgi:hypothetical protein
MVTNPRDTGFQGETASPDEIITDVRGAVLAGSHWYPALLDGIARWRVPEELIGDRRYRYLVGGEAFDWLVLAERILDTIGDVVPSLEKDALLYHGRPPEGCDDAGFRRAIGPAKYRAYLNYYYGVTVEEALQLSVEEEVAKERRAHVSGSGEGTVEDVAFRRIYGKTKDELLTEFRAERGHGPSDTISLDELKDYTYWLFKYRLKTAAPPRVASDTTRGLTRLAQLEALRRPTASTLLPAQDVLDLQALRL